MSGHAAASPDWEAVLSWQGVGGAVLIAVVSGLLLIVKSGRFFAASRRRPAPPEDAARPVDEAIESLRALAETPGCLTAATSLAEIVKDAAREIGDDTKLENIIRVSDGSDTAAATAVMTAWQQHVQHSPAVTSPATAQHLCDRMDELTARTRQDLNAEGKE